MSDQFLVPSDEPTTDLTDKDLAKIEAFKDAGLPGLYGVSQQQVERIMDLYFDGKPFMQISRILKIDKTLIMYMSQKFHWFQARREYHEELEASMRSRLVESKLVSQDFLLQLTGLYQKKISKQVTSFLATNDDSHAKAIDPKEVGQLLKLMEMLHKLGSDGSGSKAVSPVSLGLGDGVTIRKTSDNSVEITPKAASVAETLRQFADAQRAADKQNK